MPAEWYPQSAIYLAWPASPELWPHSRPQIFLDFAYLIHALSDYTKVKLLCVKASQKQAIKYLGSCKNLELIDIETNDVWCRDFGPISVKTPNGKVEIVNWNFNAWGGKFANFAKDNAVAKKLSQLTSQQCHHSHFIFEGGAIDVNGEGLGITTKSVLYNTNRNADNKHKELTEAIHSYFGLDDLITLEDGLINDDTDGHIDNITRFFSSNGVLTCTCDHRNPNFSQLNKNLEQLKNFRFANGDTLNIVELPLPEPIFYEGEILPASYANFLISNEAVFVPAFSQEKNDLRAQEIIQACFPNKTIIPIDCRLFLLEGGALHCLSQQEIST